MDQYIPHFFQIIHSVNSWLAVFWQVGELVRYRILDTLAPWISLNDFELFPGLVFGDVDLLSIDTKKQLKIAGILHALSASGSNVGIVGMFSFQITRSTNKKIQIILEAVSIVIYLAMVGESAPIIRAILSRLYLLFGQHFHLQTHGIFAWAMSALLMVCAKPSFLGSISFQLSALASLGIVLFLPRLSDDNLHQSGRLAEFFREAFWQTAAAQLFVLPLSLLVFGESPTSALLTNTILAPLLLALTLNAFILAVFGAICGLLQAGNLQMLITLILPLKDLIIASYRLINQSFMTILSAISSYASALNHTISHWWLFGFIILIFAFRFGRNYKQISRSCTFAQRLGLQYV